MDISTSWRSFEEDMSSQNMMASFGRAVSSLWRPAQHATPPDLPKGKLYTPEPNKFSLYDPTTVETHGGKEFRIFDIRKNTNAEGLYSQIITLPEWRVPDGSKAPFIWRSPIAIQNPESIKQDAIKSNSASESMRIWLLLSDEEEVHDFFGSHPDEYTFNVHERPSTLPESEPWLNVKPPEEWKFIENHQPPPEQENTFSR
jgi:hypothetical protein